MLFLVFGTGVGSALIADHVVIPLELCVLPYRKKEMGRVLRGRRAHKPAIEPRLQVLQAVGDGMYFFAGERKTWECIRCGQWQLGARKLSTCIARCGLDFQTP